MVLDTRFLHLSQPKLLLYPVGVSDANFHDTLTELRLPDLAEDELFSCVFICFVSEKGVRIVVKDVLIAMHGRQNRTAPDHGMLHTGGLTFSNGSSAGVKA